VPCDAAMCVRLGARRLWTHRAPLLLQRIMAVNYEFPPELRLSMQCVDLIRRMLVGTPDNRITIVGIKAHPWFTKNLPAELQVRSCRPSASPFHFLRLPALMMRSWMRCLFMAAK
jgi:serine/threonine protein kinase